MRSFTSALPMIIGLLAGCSMPASPVANHVEAPALTTLTSAELAKIAKSVDQPVIVEFSVLHGCDRCAKMRPEVRKLAAHQSEQISIVRADFTTNQPLLQSLGATLCPSYVLFTPDAPPQFHISPSVLVSMADQSHVAIAP